MTSSVTVTVPSIIVLPVAESTRNLVIGVPAPLVILKYSVAAAVLPEIVTPLLNVARLVTPRVPCKVVLPATFAVPPTQRFSLIPAPPVTTRVPVDVLLEPTLLLRARLPAITPASVPEKTSEVFVAL